MSATCATSATWEPDLTLSLGEVNGHAALIARVGGEIDTVITARIDDGLVTGLHAVRNPAKLTHMGREVTLRR